MGSVIRFNRLILLVFFSLVILSCADESSDRDELVKDLSKSNLARTPVIIGPNIVERSLLDQSDNQTLSSANATSRLDNSISALAEKAEISINVVIYMEDDYRTHPLVRGAIGGMAGHGFVSIDGKYLDILSEFSNYRALHDLGITTQSRIAAIDMIVNWHNQNFGSVEAIQYPYGPMSDEARLISDRYFDDYLGFILFHEFGHYYFYHALVRLRSIGTPFQGLFSYTTLNEDASDRLAGMLAAKVGNDLDNTLEAVDLMAYYNLQGRGLLTSFAQVQNSLEVQFFQEGPTHSSIAVRKKTVSSGYKDFDD